MKIEEVIDLYQKDCKIDETELSRESLNTPILHGKYLKIYSEERLKLRSYKIKRDELTSKLMDYYKGDLNNPEDLEEIGREPWPKKVLKQDLRYHIESDKEMVDINIKVAYQEELVDVCQEIIKNINNRGFVIKNSIDFMRFTMGG